MLNFMIDVQALQTDSRLRGIGRSLSEILENLVCLDDNIRWHFILNSTLYKEVSPIIKLFSKKNKKIIFHTVQTMPNSAPIINDNLLRNKISEQIYALYIQYIKPDFILIPNIFEGFTDDSVLCIDLLNDVKKGLIVHDFIPYLNQSIYFDGKPFKYKEFYMQRLEQINNIDLICVISDSVKNEVNHVLPHYNGCVDKISSGVSDKFRKYEKNHSDYIFEKYNISDPYMLYTGGYDERKNINNLLLAFSLFLSQYDGASKLVLCGPIDEFTKNEILSFCNAKNISIENIIITGYVDDYDLINFYNAASLYVFPSWHEGFGLPVLEAIKCGTLVIASNLTSLPEVVGTPEALFDPFDINHIASLMMKFFLPSEEKTLLLEKQYQNSLQFDWKNTAQLILAGAKKILEHDICDDEIKWDDVIERLNGLDQKTFEQLKNIKNFKLVNEKDKILLSNIIANNRNKAERILKNIYDFKKEKIIIEGPYDSNYSLAIVNRYLALEIKNIHKEVYLKSSDGLGDYKPSSDFLSSHPEISEMQFKEDFIVSGSDIVSRCMYPPRCEDMKGPLNAIHCYAWEETGFPLSYVREMNANIQLISVVSKHVKNILINNGVNVPISVVGNGIDHYYAIKSKNINLPKASYVFLHISSCFPRKGIDLLIKAYCEEFTSLDDVLLIIKTFKNPHNNIQDILIENTISKKYPPKILVIDDDLEPSELNYIYENSHCFVAPSRAEGFGLPFAEAKLKGLRLITTAWGGALDFCTNNDTILLDYDFSESQSHLDLCDSVWAEPRFDNLKAAMRKCFQEKSDFNRNQIIEENLKLIEEYSWNNVSKKIYGLLTSDKTRNITVEPKIGFVSPIFKRCGIATYSEHLINHMGGQVNVYADYNSSEKQLWPINTKLCWKENDDDLYHLKSIIINDDIDVVVVQFNYGFYEFSAFADFLSALIDLDKIVVVELHSTIDPHNIPNKNIIFLKNVLAKCNRLIVHDINDMNRLKKIGIVDNVALIPHGILYDFNQLIDFKKNRKKVKIASFGFFLPGKGLLELIEAFHLASSQDKSIELHMYNSEYPTESSRNLIKSAHEMINQFQNKNIFLDTDFHSDEETFNKLSDCDLIIYPYQQSNESASGAVRYGLSSGAVVLVSPLAVFNNVEAIVCQLSGFDPISIASDIKKYAQLIKEDSDFLNNLKVKQINWVRSHSYVNIGYKYRNMLQSLFLNKDN
jgi:glycosyltransferase involved in cell wall biosynthesis